MARACIVAGRFTEAREFARRTSIRTEVEEPDYGVAAWADWALVECAVLEGETGADLPAALNKIIQEADRRGMKPLRAHCLATIAGLTRDTDLAKEARALAGAMGMLRLVGEIDALVL